MKKVSCKEAVARFRALLGLRDWLAHGRYWRPKLGRKTRVHTPEDALAAVEGLFGALPLAS